MTVSAPNNSSIYNGIKNIVTDEYINEAYQNKHPILSALAHFFNISLSKEYMAEHSDTLSLLKGVTDMIEQYILTPESGIHHTSREMSINCNKNITLYVRYELITNQIGDRTEELPALFIDKHPINERSFFTESAVLFNPLNHPDSHPSAFFSIPSTVMKTHFFGDVFKALNNSNQYSFINMLEGYNAQSVIHAATIELNRLIEKEHQGGLSTEESEKVEKLTLIQDKAREKVIEPKFVEALTRKYLSQIHDPIAEEKTWKHFLSEGFPLQALARAFATDVSGESARSLLRHAITHNPEIMTPLVESLSRLGADDFMTSTGEFSFGLSAQKIAWEVLEMMKIQEQNS